MDATHISPWAHAARGGHEGWFCERDRAEMRRLAPFVAGAVVVHIALLSMIHRPASAPFPSVPIVVELVPPSAPAPRPRPPQPVPATNPQTPTAPMPPLRPQEPESGPDASRDRSAIVPQHRLTRLPQPLAPIRPGYPEIERSQGREASVLAEITVNRSGRVELVTILRGAGRHFDAAVERTLLETRFEPGILGDRAVATRMQITIHFRLN